MIFNRETIWTLWESLAPRLEFMNEISFPSNQILINQKRYQSVADELKMPFYIIGCLHYRESNFNWNTWLCNGDHLFDADGTPISTVRKPAGLEPVKSWEEGAVMSLQIAGFGGDFTLTRPSGNPVPPRKWDLISSLESCERYNGLGYRLRNIYSPYVWSMTNAYKSGKFSADGKFDPKLTDKQAGVAALLWYLSRKANVDIDEISPDDEA